MNEQHVTQITGSYSSFHHSSLRLLVTHHSSPLREDTPFQFFLERRRPDSILRRERCSDDGRNSATDFSDDCCGGDPDPYVSPWLSFFSATDVTTNLFLNVPLRASPPMSVSMASEAETSPSDWCLFLL